MVANEDDTLEVHISNKATVLGVLMTKRRRMRLIEAKLWVPLYMGKNIGWDYAQHFRVDSLCAINDLEILGYQVATEYKAKLKKRREDRERLREERNQAKKEENSNELFVSDDVFCFIAGHTSGGAPYGVTWEEMDSNGSRDESYLYEGRLENMDGEETEEADRDFDGSGLFLKIHDEEDDIPF